jgi:large subunit ribosomal protein L32e
MTNPKTKPNFHRQVSHAYRRLQKAWRKPRGLQSKMRASKNFKGKMPAVGYGAPKKLRWLHPSGYEEVLVHNVGGLDGVNATKQAVRIAGSVGGKKRAEILKVTQEKKMKVLNP